MTRSITRDKLSGAFALVATRIADGIGATGLTAVDTYDRLVARRRTVTGEEISIWNIVNVFHDTI